MNYRQMKYINCQIIVNSYSLRVKSDNFVKIIEFMFKFRSDDFQVWNCEFRLTKVMIHEKITHRFELECDNKIIIDFKNECFFFVRYDLMIHWSILPFLTIFKRKRWTSNLAKE
jgi:hypothetical protein